MIEFFVDDSDDEKIVNFVNSLTQEEVNGETSSSRVPRSRIYVARDREDAAIRLYNDYFAESPVFPDKYLKRRFRMSRELFLRIVEGSINCMHWEWKNCPVAWQGQYTRGDQKGPSVMLEAVASQDLWIWHAFFGMAGSNNDINVLNFSPLFNTIKVGTAPPSPFEVNGRRYERGYYLGDGIYPDWAMLVKVPHNPTDEPCKKFKRFQESARKDIERAFGVLQGRFLMLKSPARSIDFNKIRRYMYACVVLHNMIQENNGFVI
ncbi:protein ALP1-like [Rutidosis leptorrhynchoides]|uniref:protein ALP1-like n=1 Tax=Rutidosis leptorrhynchoides TaxID=125765 RepID=UPI003A9A1FF4